MKCRIWRGRKKQPEAKKKQKKLRGSVMFVWNLLKAVNSIWGSLGTQREATKSCVYPGRMRDTMSHWPKLFGSQSFFSGENKTKPNPPSSLTWKTRIKMKEDSGNIAWGWGASEVITVLKKSLAIWKYGWQYGRLKWEVCRDDAMGATDSSATCMFL